MAKQSEKQMLEELKDFDTPSITNVVATYPGYPLCLGLYSPLSRHAPGRFGVKVFIHTEDHLPLLKPSIKFCFRFLDAKLIHSPAP